MGQAWATFCILGRSGCRGFVERYACSCWKMAVLCCGHMFWCGSVVQCGTKQMVCSDPWIWRSLMSWDVPEVSGHSGVWEPSRSPTSGPLWDCQIGWPILPMILNFSRVPRAPSPPPRELAGTATLQMGQGLVPTRPFATRWPAPLGPRAPAPRCPGHAVCSAWGLPGRAMPAARSHRWQPQRKRQPERQPQP